MNASSVLTGKPLSRERISLSDALDFSTINNLISEQDVECTRQSSKKISRSFIRHRRKVYGVNETDTKFN